MMQKGRKEQHAISSDHTVAIKVPVTAAEGFCFFI